MIFTGFDPLIEMQVLVITTRVTKLPKNSKMSLASASLIGFSFLQCTCFEIKVTPSAGDLQFLYQYDDERILEGKSQSA